MVTVKLKLYCVPATMVVVGTNVSDPALVHAAVLLNTLKPVCVMVRGCVAVVVPERPPRTTVVLMTLTPVKQLVYSGRPLVKVTVNVLDAHGLGVA